MITTRCLLRFTRGAALAAALLWLLARTGQAATAERLDKDAQRHVDLGRYVAQFRDYERAAQHFEQALEKEPKSKGIMFSLGALYQKSGEYDKAEEVYKKLLLCYPVDVDGHVCLGNVYLAQERLDQAVKQYQEAVALNRNNAVAYRNLGYAHLRAGAAFSAVEALSRAVTLDPSNALAFVDLAMAQYAQGKPREAQAAFRTAFALGAVADARATYTDMLDALAGARLAAAIAAYSSNDFDSAAAQLAALIADFPDYALAHAYLGHVLHHRNPPQLEEAEAAYRRALAANAFTVLSPIEHVCVLDNLGMIRMNEGDYAEAEQLFRAGTAMNTSYPIVYFNYGLMLARKQAYEASAVAFADAVRRDRTFLAYVQSHVALKPFRATAAYSNLLTSCSNELLRTKPE